MVFWHSERKKNDENSEKIQEILNKLKSDDRKKLRELIRRKILKEKTDIAPYFTGNEKIPENSTASVSDSKADTIKRDLNEYQELENKA